MRTTDRSLVSYQVYVGLHYTVSQKTPMQSFCDTFGKRGPIFFFQFAFLEKLQKKLE